MLDFGVRREIAGDIKGVSQDTWAKSQLLAVRDEILSELQDPLALINTNVLSSFEPLQSVRWAYELFKDDGEIQEALQQYSTRIQLALDEYWQRIARLLEMPPTLRLLQVSHRFVARVGEILQLIRPLSPLLFSVDWLQSQSDQLSVWQRRLDQHQEQLDMLISEGMSLRLEYSHQDTSLPDEGLSLPPIGRRRRQLKRSISSPLRAFIGKKLYTTRHFLLLVTARRPNASY
ncbi:MAG: hypothetical protein IPJ94_22995 [Chloroflexi bacterium]|nr:hypothetical protein [Chloroflexota bacterium]